MVRVGAGPPRVTPPPSPRAASPAAAVEVIAACSSAANALGAGATPGAALTARVGRVGGEEAAVAGVEPARTGPPACKAVAPAGEVAGAA